VQSRHPKAHIKLEGRQPAGLPVSALPNKKSSLAYPLKLDQIRKIRLPRFLFGIAVPVPKGISAPSSQL
jgi:hypothetical protein